MAYDDRDPRGRDHNPRPESWRPERRSPHPQRLGDRNWRGERDDPDYGQPRYGPGEARGLGRGMSSDPDSLFGAPGYDPEFPGPRFDRIDVGSTGTHGVHPVSSAYGADYRGAVGVTPGGGFASSARLYAEAGRSGRHDPHYSEWRRRQIEQLDRDYDEYRGEHQRRFEQEYGAWRERRGQQRESVGRVREHMEVVGSDGRHVGKVDGTSGDSIVLTRSDPNAGGQHHHIPCGWVERVDDKVVLNLTGDEAMRRWHEEERSGALFERESGRSRGPHILNRSFSGTYDQDERDE